MNDIPQYITLKKYVEGLSRELRYQLINVLLKKEKKNWFAWSMHYVYRYIPPKCFTERWFSLITWTQKMLDTTLEIFDVGNIKRIVAVTVKK